MVEWIDGIRVRVAPHSCWPNGATGTVRPFPKVAELCVETNGCSRVVHGRLGPLTMVWVVFDYPVQDGESDGPYVEGEILSGHLCPE